MYLLLSIAASTFIFIIFKLLGKYNINTLHAIVVNYFVACLLGIVLYDGKIVLAEIVASYWFYGALVLGFLFISIFNVMALTAQRNGLSVASVASKMSVILPVVFGIYVYDEGVGFQKLLGIFIALIAVYLTSLRAKSSVSLTKGIWLPIILFFGSGTIDTMVKYLETTYVPDNGIPIFSATIFLFAFIIGIGLLAFNRFIKPRLMPTSEITSGEKKQKSDWRVLLGGSALGIVNYMSIYYLLKALDHETLESSTLFTVNNVAIVMISTLLGLLVFKEKISKINWLGISLAIVSIVLVTLA
ncbi:EamA family transporter [Subsaximicrobium wynnwilliamsii]|uniref:EamA family transporter n=1 Tax=Subsaximicrobium wynnwilliamsii TaxID=291179 RepID=A0A5C6ZP21_9FLAO|nr:EamA family transporter [Subsaximicrobium wynnwilliamsii]TXD85174.1 EamA family transporter [Subsaximicrobium wynnwilliamsii]TXD91217.1 EamA family transporter [Subsaximicrobium wynnwilliamsii]TXE04610.1 EamA family transporter [Subsaximicrobium wynnwilliamsii]